MRARNRISEAGVGVTEKRLGVFDEAELRSAWTAGGGCPYATLDGLRAPFSPLASGYGLGGFGRDDSGGVGFGGIGVGRSDGRASCHDAVATSALGLIESVVGELEE